MTLPDDLRRQVHRDARASLRTLGLLEAAADEIERLQRPDGREAPVWSALIRAMFLRTGWKSCDLSEHYCGDPEETRTWVPTESYPSGAWSDTISSR